MIATLKLIIQVIVALPEIFNAVKKFLDWQKQESARKEEEKSKARNAELAKDMQDAIDSGDIEKQKEALRRMARGDN